MCVNTGCTNCNGNCGCNCESCCNNDCNNCCDPCNEQPCGCPFEVDFSCVRYTGSLLDCVQLQEGETLEQAMLKLNELLCGLSEGEDGLDGDSAYQIWLNLGNTGSEQDFIDSLQGQDGEDAEPCDACIDSGWQDLEGFDYYSGIQKPQVRRMGNQLHFRGDVIVPLDAGEVGGVLPIFDQTTYNFIPRATPYTGGGGVTIDSQNRLIFNNDSNVIPISVLPLATNLDGSYNNPNYFASRGLAIDGSNPGTVTTVLLNSFLKLEITEDKKLILSAIDSLETDPTDTSPVNLIGASPLRKAISSFVGRDLPIDFKRFEFLQASSGMTSTDGVSVLVNDALISGQAYRILDFSIGDDFTVSGAVSNTDGAVFIANGTPPVWSNGTKITRILNEGFMNFDNSLSYPVIVDTSSTGLDASKHDEIGGFKLNIDGLIAYL